MLTRFRKIAYIMAYTVATIPLWHYIRDGRILALMVAVVAFAYINIVLSTVEVAQPILSSEKAKTPLPRWLSDKPKYHKWWILIRHTLKWHLLLVAPKMGLALGFVEKLYDSWIGSIPFSHVYSYSDYSVHNNFPVLYPHWEMIIISLMIIFIFAMCESSLLAAITLTTKSLRLIVQKCVFACLIRVTVIFFFVGLGMVIFHPFEVSVVPRDFYCRPTPVYENGVNVYKDEEHVVLVTSIQDKRCNLKRLIDTAYISIMTPYDQGTLLAANIMRPWGQLTYAEIGTRRINGRDDNIWDNRPFVARQVVAGMLGLLLYAGATWGVLWFVEDETVSE